MNQGFGRDGGRANGQVQHSHDEASSLQLQQPHAGGDTVLVKEPWLESAQVEGGVDVKVLLRQPRDGGDEMVTPLLKG